MKLKLFDRHTEQKLDLALQPQGRGHTAERQLHRRVFSAAKKIAVATMAVTLLSAASASAMLPFDADIFADLAEKHIDAVVNISTKTIREERTGRGNNQFRLPPGSPFEGTPFNEFFERFFDGPGQKQQRPRNLSSLGSGFVISSDGLIVTNHHVIKDADEIKVTLADGSVLPASLVGSDQKIDVAVLKVESDRKLNWVELGDSDLARVGELVMAIGNPFGLGGSVTTGIVSARNRNINASQYDEFIQTDAAINRGNSGGPLFNLDGEVIGVNTAIYSPSGGSAGIAFAIPSNIVRSAVEQITEFGEVRRGWLGVQIQNISEDLADAIGLRDTSGALVVQAFDDTPAQAAGVQAGDVILEFDGQEIENSTELPKVVANTPVGKQVVIKIIRDGKPMDIRLRIAQLEEEKVETKESPNDRRDDSQRSSNRYGLELSALDRRSAETYGYDKDTEGVVVTGIDRDSLASDLNTRGLLREGDLITEIANRRATSPRQVARTLDDLRSDGANFARLRIQRPNGQVLYVALPLSG